MRNKNEVAAWLPGDECFFYRNFYKLRGSKFVVDNKIMIFRKAEAEKVFLCPPLKMDLKKLLCKSSIVYTKLQTS